jgi:hypothetical protein
VIAVDLAAPCSSSRASGPLFQKRTAPASCSSAVCWLILLPSTLPHEVGAHGRDEQGAQAGDFAAVRLPTRPQERRPRNAAVPAAVVERDQTGAT